MALFKKENKKKEKDASKERNGSGTKETLETNDDYLKKELYLTVRANLDYVKGYQGDSWDFVTREFTLENNYQEINIGLIYYAGLVDQMLLNKTVIDALNQNFSKAKKAYYKDEERFDFFKTKVMTTIGVDETDNFGILFNTLSSGDMIVLIDDCSKCLIIGARSYQERQVEKPSTQITVMGSNDSFNENLLTNLSLVRKRIKNPNLITQNYIIGKDSNTNVNLVYIKGIADENILMEIKRRLKVADVPKIIDTHNLEVALSEKQFSIFPKFFYSERPDTVASNLLDGRIVIMTDSTPEALILPTLFVQFLHSADDIQQKAIIASYFRILRTIGLILSLFLPSLYILIIVHHSELLPVQLLYSIAGQRVTTPMPPYLELFTLLIAFDLLRESGARMPIVLGGTLSFVGAIIIGQSAVEAGLISPVIVIIGALTGIGAMLIPNYKLNLTVTVLKYVFAMISMYLGFFGFTLSLIILIFHLSSLRSFGVDYFAPFAPFSKEGQKDAIIRFPLNKLRKEKRKKEQYPF